MEAYPDIEPYDTGCLAVSDLHQMYYEQCGNPAGRPVVHLHGGPGSGTRPAHRTLFDPEVYRVVLFDQRGAGKSTPTGELKDNTTWDLVSDIEMLREHLGIDTWVVVGCSWGSTLALAYAQTHPDRVKAMVIGGIFTCQRQEVAWLNRSGAHLLFPDVYEEYVQPIPEGERYDLVGAYYRRFTGSDEAVKLECAKAWVKFEDVLSTLKPQPRPERTSEDDRRTVVKACIECHYFVHGGFLETEGQLLANAHRLSRIPMTIIHGRYDLVCPLDTAWKLHKALPHADFLIIPDAGHSSLTPETRVKLVEACDKYKHL